MEGQVLGSGEGALEPVLGFESSSPVSSCDPANYFMSPLNLENGVIIPRLPAEVVVEIKQVNS